VMPPPASRLFLTACCRPMLVVLGRCECVCVLAPVFWSAVLCIWRVALSCTSLALGLELERSHVEAALQSMLTPGLALSLEARPNSKPCRRIEPCATIRDPWRDIVAPFFVEINFTFSLKKRTAVGTRTNHHATRDRSDQCKPNAAAPVPSFD